MPGSGGRGKPRSLPFTEAADRVCRYAEEEARRLGAAAIETEHLLLGVARAHGTAAARLLRQLGVDPERLRGELEPRLTRAAADEGRALELAPLTRQAIELARREAVRLGDNHIGSEHLLLGLLAEEQGAAHRALKELGADPGMVRQAVRFFGEPPPWPAPDPEEARPEWLKRLAQQVREGDPPAETAARERVEATKMWQRFTERARRVVFFAQEEAARLGESYVSTEHLLLGLVRESDSVAARILDRLGVPLGQVRAEIERQVSRGAGNLDQDMRLTPRAKRVIDLAYEEARQLNNNYIGTEHLLLGLVREGEGLAARVLVKLGAKLEPTRAEVKALQDEAPAQEPVPARPARRRQVADLTPAEAAARLADLAWGEEQLRQRRALEGPARGEDLAWGEGQEARTPYVRHCLATALPGFARLRGITDLTREGAEALLACGRLLKRTLDSGKDAHLDLLRGQALALVFEKPSLRTRVSFEVGMFQLGGHALFLGPSDIQMGKRESIADCARNLGRMVDGIMARTFAHATVVELAEHAGVPVINGLSDLEHPCQALADYLTIQERLGEIAGNRLVFVGDGNNVLHSFLLLGTLLGANVVHACPEGYGPKEEVLTTARAYAQTSGGSVEVSHAPEAAAAEADVIYTDVWTSMGGEAEAEQRREIFQPFQVNAELLKRALPDAIVLHCLPARRGEEITDEVLDGPQSAVLDQAENRLHAQKAVLLALLGR